MSYPIPSDIKLSTGKRITHERAQNGSVKARPEMSEAEFDEYLIIRSGGDDPKKGSSRPY